LDSTNQPENELFLKDLTENDSPLKIDYPQQTDIAVPLVAEVNTCLQHFTIICHTT
jgi:hypothetical protein